MRLEDKVRGASQSTPGQRAAWWVHVLFWSLVCATVVLSLMPVERLPQAAHVWDKAQHALGFAGLAFLGLQVGGRRPLTTLVALALLGVFIELAQHVSGWRQGDWQDWVADVIGLALGWQALGLARYVLVRVPLFPR